METIIAEFTDREYRVTVTSEEFDSGWNLYRVHLTAGREKLAIGQYDLMPLVRKLYQAYEVIQKEEEKIAAEEAEERALVTMLDVPTGV